MSCSSTRRKDSSSQAPRPKSGETIPQGSDIDEPGVSQVMARIAWHYALAHPITGVGLGTMHLRVQQSPDGSPTSTRTT